MSYLVLAQLRVKEEKREFVESLFAGLAEACFDEDGCIQYRITKSKSEAGLYFIFEEYYDEASLEIHKQSVHFKEIVEKQIAPCLEEFKVQLIEELG